LKDVFFHTWILFLDARSLYVEVKAFSFGPCKLVFIVFKCYKYLLNRLVSAAILYLQES
jgi:hypothetical protein